MTREEAIVENVILKAKIQQLESFIEQELGISSRNETQHSANTSSCASPISYCDSCGCGKKERILKETKK